MTSILWRRLDTPGHDACLLEQTSSGARLQGTAVFLHEEGAARLHYEVTCDPSWRSQSGSVSGWIGRRRVDVRIVREDSWTIDGRAVPGLEHCLDLDFGFTPATNLLQLRRIALEVGQQRDVPAAWFDVDEEGLILLPQTYERRSESTYWYESPTADYAAELEVDRKGFTRHYPELWIAETPPA
jgi:hypothetical protein